MRGKKTKFGPMWWILEANEHATFQGSFSFLDEIKKAGAMPKVFPCPLLKNSLAAAWALAMLSLHLHVAREKALEMSPLIPGYRCGRAL